ncbi:unnamed protein product [Linum tenue]|uniref:Uncharacterized protein n=1 Tax=Linum tenue TaxID=586396 RepID=A0AAV0LXY3_9ROSI|nr:unnamed protein product [Linum tenue]
MDYAELKKEAMQEPMSDLEKGRESKEYHNKKYFEEVKLVEVEIKELDILLHDLKLLTMKLDLKSTTNNETINNKIITILQKAKTVKTTLEWLYKANPDQVSITGGLRARLRRVVKDLWSLKDQGFDPAKGEERTKELEELFVEMAVWVELNGEDDEEIRSIEGEDCVGRTEGSFCGDGVGLYLAERMKKQRKNWKCWVGLLLLLVLVSLLAILAQ